MSATFGDPLSIGDLRIDRIVDIDSHDMPASRLLPDIDLAELAAERHWLEPQHMRGDDLRLSIHSLLLRVDGRVVLVDTCVGEGKLRPRQPHWHARADSPYLANLAAHGLTPDDVDVVFCTHLHADHVGWNTRRADGRWIPTFPNARYLFGRAELAFWEAAIRAGDTEANHGSYADSVSPVIAAGLADLVDVDHEVAHGCVVRPLPGHTVGQMGVSLTRGDARGLITGDAIHHPPQLVAPEVSSALCHDAAMARRTRETFLAEIAERGDWLVPMHFRGGCGFKIRRQGRGYRFRAD